MLRACCGRACCGAFAMGSLVATGFTLFTAWVPLTLWAHGHRNPMAFFIACGGMTVSWSSPCRRV